MSCTPGLVISLLCCGNGMKLAGLRHRVSGIDCAAVTFIVNASRDENVATTVRLSAAVAVAKANALREQGWKVFITGPDGRRHDPPHFEQLLKLDSAL
jgi:hypothetical protein